MTGDLNLSAGPPLQVQRRNRAGRVLCVSRHGRERYTIYSIRDNCKERHDNNNALINKIK